jgi:hypothetical protein
MTDKEKFDDQACVLIVQKHQLDNVQSQLGRLDVTLDAMLAEQAGNQECLDQLLSQAQSYVTESYIAIEMNDEEALLIKSNLYVEANEISSTHQEIKTLDHIEITDSTDWRQYLDQVEAYAEHHDIKFGKDPFQNLMSASQRIALEKRIKKEFSLKGTNCDKYDYMIAGTCGLIGGLIDVIFVGIPGNSIFGDATDKYADKATAKFANFLGFDRCTIERNYIEYYNKNIAKGETSLELESYVAQRRLQFLEGKFKINYDQTSTNGKNGTGGKVKNLSPSNHHLKSLGHSPDIIGLFFSILNQFTSTSSFVSEGKLITIKTEDFELQGSNFVAKVFCGFVNWFGHIMSDLAGSNNSIANNMRGMGVPIPFYSLLQFINVGEFGQHKQTFAKISVQVFEQGYDFRHGMALATPVLVTELLTRMTWVVKQYLYHKKPWAKCIPSANNPELRRMLLIGHGSLCLVDTTDAALRSGGNMIQFMLRSNLIAWARFGTIALKELRAWYREGDLDIEAVDIYLEAEYKRILTA